MPRLVQHGIATAAEVDIDHLADRLRNEVVSSNGVLTTWSFITAWGQKGVAFTAMALTIGIATPQQDADGLLAEGCEPPFGRELLDQALRMHGHSHQYILEVEAAILGEALEGGPLIRQIAHRVAERRFRQHDASQRLALGIDRVLSHHHRSTQRAVLGVTPMCRRKCLAK